MIAASKSQAKFSLVMDANGSAAVVLRELLNYDTGDVQFPLEVYAKDDGSPSRNTSTVVEVRVKRDESRVLRFTGDVYHSQFKEHFPITVGTTAKSLGPQLALVTVGAPLRGGWVCNLKFFLPSSA